MFYFIKFSKDLFPSFILFCSLLDNINDGFESRF
jgi:hypothetical protein